MSRRPPIPRQGGSSAASEVYKRQGIEGRGIVACCVPPNTESAKKKIKDARLTLWSGASLSEQIKTMMKNITARAEAIEANT